MSRNCHITLDFGNNASGNRSDLTIFKIAKNSLFDNPKIETISFSYPEQTDFSKQKSNTTNFDCEAFIVSKDSIYLFSKQWKSSKTNIYVLPNEPGNHIAKFKSTLDTKGLVTGATYLEDKKIIISVGRLVHRKGQDKLIQAMPAVLQKVPNAHLLLVGEGPYRSHLEKLAKKLSVQENVTFAGRILYDKLPSYLSAADLFAMPSRSRFFGLEVEGLGIVYLEASACGIPVVAGNSGGAPDAVLEGVTGLCVDGTDVKCIAQAVIDICSDAKRASNMGSAGRNWVVDQWRWEIWSEEFNALLVD